MRKYNLINLKTKKKNLISFQSVSGLLQLAGIIIINMRFINKYMLNEILVIKYICISYNNLYY